MSNLLKNLLIVLVISLVLWVAYVLFLRSNPTEQSLSVLSSGSGQAQVESQQLLSTIQKLKSYNVESDIFTDQRFVSLNDFRIQLLDEPTGRTDPFAPVQ